MKTKTLPFILVALLLVGCRGMPGMWGTPKHRPSSGGQESTQGSAQQSFDNREQQQAQQK